MTERDLDFALDTNTEYESPKEMRVEGTAGRQKHGQSVVSGISRTFSGIVNSLSWLEDKTGSMVQKAEGMRR